MNPRRFTLLLAAVALSLSACGRHDDRLAAANPELPSTAHGPGTADRPAAGTTLNLDTRDPSIPENPANTDPTKRDTSPPYGMGEPAAGRGG